MKVLIIAGGTGGHVFPALSIAKKFSNPNSYKFVNAKLDDWLKTNQAEWLRKGS